MSRWARPGAPKGNGWVARCGPSGWPSSACITREMVGLQQLATDFFVILTCPDYFHLTKRFGIVAASQLPLHYLLAAKTPYSPLQILLRCSHEQLNATHQVMGRVITFFFSLHALFYLNAFAQKGILAERLTHKIIILGLTAIVCFNLVGTTALSFVRNWNYRLFYGLHIVVATAVLPLLYFHVHHIRIYIWETLGVYVLHIVLRLAALKTYEGNVAMVADTNLVKVEIPLPRSKAASIWKPGQHVYLQIPRGSLHLSSTASMAQEVVGLRSNPFTIASLPQLDSKLLLVARSLRGNTRDLAALAHSMSLHSNVESPTLKLKIDGPYGASSWLPDFTGFDTILLVAGGVGATFIVPLWRSICMTRSPSGGILADRVRFVWAVKSLSETSWAFPSAEANSVLPHATKGVEVYVTTGKDHSLSSRTMREAGPGASTQLDAGEAIELQEREGLMAAVDGQTRQAEGLNIKHGRPNVGDVVDDACGTLGGRVAVLACGPHGLTAQLRAEVGKWVRKGQDVYWHAEEFGY